MLRFLSPGDHQSHLSEESSNKARISSGQDRLKMLPEVSPRGIETQVSIEIQVQFPNHKTLQRGEEEGEKAY